MAMLEWKFKEYLDRHEITPYRLGKELGGQVSHRLTYDWAKERPERLHLEVLERVMSALETLTGEPVEITDFLEFVPDPEPEQMDQETKAWLESDLSRLGEVDAYEWAEGEAEEGEVLHYVPGQGWASGG